MNFTLEFWKHLFVDLAPGTTIVVLMATLFARVNIPAIWRKAILQAGMVSLFLILAAGASGLWRPLAYGWMHSFATQTSGKIATPDSPPPDGEPGDAMAIPIRPFNPSLLEGRFQPKPVQWPGILWLIGCAILMFRLVGVHLVLRWMRHRSSLIDDESLFQITREVAQRFGFGRKITLIESRHYSSPIAFGCFQPCIGLPLNFRTRFQNREQAVVISHEVAHLAAKDPFWRWMADLVCALLWWQPLVWWLRKRWFVASETAADEASLAFENGPSILAECLVALGKDLVRPAVAGWHGMAGFHSPLGKRVDHLLRLKAGRWNRPRRSKTIGLHTAGILFLLLSTALSVARIQPRDREEGQPLGERINTAWRQSLLAAVLVPAPAAEGEEPVISSKASISDSSAAEQKEEFSSGDPLAVEVPKAASAPPGETETSPAAPNVVADAKPVSEFPTASSSAKVPEGNGPREEESSPVPQEHSEPLINVKARFIELSSETAFKLGFDWYFTGMPVYPRAFQTNVTSTVKEERSVPAGEKVSKQVTTITNRMFATVLTPVEYRDTIRKLEQAEGVQFISEPEVTNQPGRQAQMSVNEVKTIVTQVVGETDSEGYSSVNYFTEPMPFGPSLDVVSYLEDDGTSIRLKLTATLAQFLGYDGMGETVGTLQSGDAKPVTYQIPLPRFRTRQAVATVTLKNGEAMVLGLNSYTAPKNKAPLIGYFPQAGKGARSDSKNVERRFLLVFITASVVDEE